MINQYLSDMAKGGYRENAGRKSKADEQRLIERLTPIADIAHSKLQDAINNGEQWAVKLFFEYFYGKPFQRMDVTTNDEPIQPREIITTMTPEQLRASLRK